MTNTRQRLIEYLRSHAAASAADLARALGLTAADVRHHLSLLTAEGLVEPAGQRRGPGAGRPERTFRLGRLAQGDSLDRLAAALLDGLSDDEREEELRAVASRLAGALAPAGLPPARRLAALVERLNQLKYRARWEAHGEGPRVILGNCPYAAIIADHPELCRMDALLLQAHLGAPAHLRLRREPDASGEVHCLFAIESNRPAA